MTISTESAAPLFAVVGATGQQGRSVVEALRASHAAFRVRGLTRDPSKAGDLKELGVEVVYADLDKGESIQSAFKGAKYVFGVTTTDYTQWPSMDKEMRQGRNQVDAAKAAGVDTFIFSGLLPIDYADGPVPTFQVKFDIVDYARSVGGMQIKSVCPGGFISNYWSVSPPRKTPEGEYVLAMPVAAQAAFPFVDIDHDFGRFVVAALKEDSPDTILAGARYGTLTELVTELSKVLAKTVTYQEMTLDDFRKAVAPHAGEGFANGLAAMYDAIVRNGYFNGEDLKRSNKLLDSPPRTLLQSLQANKEKLEKALA